MKFRPKLRHLAAVAAVAILSPLAWMATAASRLPVVDVYKSPLCGCCGAWVDHMKANGFAVRTHDVDDVPAERRKLGMPEKLGSCHTAKVGDYLLEGHVPATDIKRLLAEKPNAKGLAVPGMPHGSPGMESPQPEPYNVLLLQADGSTRVFARH